MATLQNNHNTQHGFTLIELLVTIGVLTILVSIAAPSMIDTIRRGQLNREVNAIVEHLQHTKTQAVLLKQTKSTQFLNDDATDDIPQFEFKYIAQRPGGEFSYDFMGRADVNANGQCETFTHVKDANITSSVRIYRVGKPQIFKTSSNCS